VTFLFQFDEKTRLMADFVRQISFGRPR